ncbi:hypothetical protein [Pseudoxanthomonas kaohsiungensis]|uniref:hypothetical protein n=1 Tax=Pseudoxanthomonas kaohsiungensis TaxID=283923 RepID=UPI0035AFE159
MCITVMLHAAKTGIQACQSGWSKKRHMKKQQRINDLPVKHRCNEGREGENAGFAPKVIALCTTVWAASLVPAGWNSARRRVKTRRTPAGTYPWPMVEMRRVLVQ